MARRITSLMPEVPTRAGSTVSRFCRNRSPAPLGQAKRSISFSLQRRGLGREGTSDYQRPDYTQDESGRRGGFLPTPPDMRVRVRRFLAVLTDRAVALPLDRCHRLV